MYLGVERTAVASFVGDCHLLDDPARSGWPRAAEGSTVFADDDLRIASATCSCGRLYLVIWRRVPRSAIEYSVPLGSGRALRPREGYLHARANRNVTDKWVAAGSRGQEPRQKSPHDRVLQFTTGDPAVAPTRRVARVHDLALLGSGCLGRGSAGEQLSAPEERWLIVARTWAVAGSVLERGTFVLSQPPLEQWQACLSFTHGDLGERLLGSGSTVGSTDARPPGSTRAWASEVAAAPEAA